MVGCHVDGAADRMQRVRLAAFVSVATGVLLAGCGGGVAVSPPHFRAAAGWHVGSRSARTCHIRQAHCVSAFGWAATVPCADCGKDEPLRTLAVLPPGGAVIQVANLRISDTHPSQQAWPPRIREADVHFASVGQAQLPIFLAMDAGRSGGTNWSLVVWFGDARPTARQLARVNTELRTVGP